MLFVHVLYAFSLYPQVSYVWETQDLVMAPVLTRLWTGVTNKYLLERLTHRERFEPGPQEYVALGHNFQFKLFLRSTKHISSNKN
jgi:hypothetical protein